MSEKTLPLEEPRGQHLQLLRPDQPSHLRSLPHDVLFSLPRLPHPLPFPILPPLLLDLLLLPLLLLFLSFLPLLLLPFTLAFPWKSMPLGKDSLHNDVATPVDNQAIWPSLAQTVNGNTCVSWT